MSTSPERLPSSRDQPPYETDLDPRATLATLLRRLHASPRGLTTREAARRLVVSGPNELQRRGQRRWPQELLRQLTHPLALLLGAAALLSLANRSDQLALAIVLVIFLNALLAFTQEVQAENAVEALGAYLPERATVLRDGKTAEIEARLLVPGDVMVVEEGARICADARLVEGEVEVDLSTLNGESIPAARAAGRSDPRRSLLDARNLVFNGTTCTGGKALALVTRTGMQTELGRIAALSERTVQGPSPLERQVKRAAWLIGSVAVGAAVAFLPLGLAAGLSIGAALSFAIGLLVANVPEGLLPTITLALAVGVRDLAQRGAVVKRLSSVETLGSTTVICTDKTGTLTENKMRVTRAWTTAGAAGGEQRASPELPTSLRELARSAAACTTADLAGAGGHPAGDPTELALLDFADALGLRLTATERDRSRRVLFHFDPHLKRMSTLDADRDGLVLHLKGAPEVVLPLCCTVLEPEGGEHRLDEDERARIRGEIDEAAAEGLRVLAVAQRRLEPATPPAAGREAFEQHLTLLGFVALLDPPRPEVAEAIATAHRAGVLVHVVTGDNGLTAAGIARRVGIGGAGPKVVLGEELEHMSEAELDNLLSSGQEVVFARSTAEEKLRVTDALHAMGEIVAVTGDGVNDAPALRRADIGVAMGAGGTDVAREAATMVLTDDNFATIVAAIEGGRRVYDNVRKFIVYIFAHAVPEVVPFVLFALSGGAVPLPLTVMQILAIDLGTDTLPALALSRERAEPGLMDEAPRSPGERVVTRSMLLRSWGFLGLVSAALVLAGFFLTLHAGGWHLHAATGGGSPLHLAYRQATTVAWLGIVACQIGTAFAVRTDRASLRSVGALSNRALLGGIVFAICFALLLTYAPPLQEIFGTAGLSPRQLLVLLPYPFVVWGADELRRAGGRHRSTSPTLEAGSRQKGPGPAAGEGPSTLAPRRPGLHPLSHGSEHRRRSR